MVGLAPYWPCIVRYCVFFPPVYVILPTLLSYEQLTSTNIPIDIKQLINKYLYIVGQRYKSYLLINMPHKCAWCLIIQVYTLLEVYYCYAVYMKAINDVWLFYCSNLSSNKFNYLPWTLFKSDMIQTDMCVP